MKILIMGSAILDVMYEVESVPKPGGDVVASNELNNLGGCALNVSAALEYQKVDHDLCLFVGNGERSEKIQKMISEECGDYANAKYLINNSGDNGYCLTLIDNNRERTFITINGAENNFDPDWVNQFKEGQYDVIYINGYMVDNYENAQVIISILKKIQPQSIYFAIGPRASVIDNRVLKELNELKVIYYLNEKELQEVTGEIKLEDGLKLLHKITDNIAVVTQGKEGCSCIDYLGVITHEKGLEIEVVNTNGAGDTHCGAFISSIANGRIDLELANKLAALATTQVKSRI